MQIRIIDRKTHTMITHPDSLDERGEKYAPALFRDFDLINEATASNSDEFMERVTEHILARKIPLHSRQKPLFYMPIKSTVLDAIIHLEPQNFMYIDAIYRNNEKVPFYTTIENHDILIYTFSKQLQIDKKWLKYAHS